MKRKHSGGLGVLFDELNTPVNWGVVLFDELNTPANWGVVLFDELNVL